ncbi:hypothetical protein GOQ29_00370 [Clostridium sp. D2Q-14]|uniref:hypothetical protein n=1 Tax=Anaeromonas gelatinilytica TaxID=2683194 RepID=UPI00193C1AE3|nr:hypothetical protein [Anaeromonas gelatinilytica]MBS4534067.1 hypothetical protein [Anaeromonas gelatinilytica]
MILLARNVITGDGKTCLKNMAILIGKDGKIEKIALFTQLKMEFSLEEVKDYGNASILPGLFDMHVHLGYYYS